MSTEVRDRAIHAADRADMQLEVLQDMADLTEAMKHKVAVLDALDRDGRERGQRDTVCRDHAGDYDLHDQITTLCDLQTKTEKVLSRSREIVDLLPRRKSK